MHNYYVYMMTNKNNSVLYTGVTNDLERRICEHQKKLIPGFTQRYNLTKLVYYEHSFDIKAAITREKQITGWVRAKRMRWSKVSILSGRIYPYPRLEILR